MVKYIVLMALVAATVVSLIILAVRSKRNGGAVAFTFSRVQFIVAAGVWGLLAAGLIAGAVVVFVRSDSPQSWLSLFFLFVYVHERLCPYASYGPGKGKRHL